MFSSIKLRTVLTTIAVVVVGVSGSRLANFWFGRRGQWMLVAMIFGTCFVLWLVERRTTAMRYRERDKLVQLLDGSSDEEVNEVLADLDEEDAEYVRSRVKR